MSRPSRLTEFLELLEDSIKGQKELIQQTVDIEEQLKILNSRLERLIWVAGVLLVGQLGVGVFTGKAIDDLPQQPTRHRYNRSSVDESRVVSWNVPYYERMD